MSSLSSASLLPSSSSSSLSSSTSSLRLVSLDQVEDVISSQPKKSLSFKEFNDKMALHPGEISISKFNPSSEQIKLLTSPSTAINVGASVATGTDISDNLMVSLDVDQMVFCSSALDPDIVSKIILSTTFVSPVSTCPVRNDFFSQIVSDATFFITDIQKIEPHSFDISRQTPLSTAVNQLKETMHDDILPDDARRVVDLMNELLPHEHLVGYTRLDAVLKFIRPYNPKLRSSFDQFLECLTSDFTLIDLGKNSDAPFRIAVLATVFEVRQAVKDIVSAWSKRKNNSNSHGSSSAEKVCDSLPSWGSANKFVTTSMKLQSLQLAVSILVLSRRQQRETSSDDNIKIICESFNQKATSHDALITMYVKIISLIYCFNFI
jgi:hypothetical protein